MQVYYDRDADLSLIRDRKVTVLGYGSQGHAHASNLRDSGVDVVVGLRRDSASWAKAADAGLTVMETAEAAEAGDVVMVLLPDELQGDVYRDVIRPGLKPGNYLAFGHGFNIHFKRVVPPEDVNVFMVAPKGPGHLVRSEFERAGGCLACWPSSRIPPETPRPWAWPMPRPSAAPAPRSSRPASRTRPKPTCSASRRCSAAASRR